MTLSRYLRTLALYLRADARDAQAMSTYARMAVTPQARMMLLSGLAGFDRSIKLEV